MNGCRCSRPWHAAGFPLWCGQGGIPYCGLPP